jgi:hypothetical protein
VLCAGSTLLLAKQSLDEAPHINCLKLSLSQSASPSVVLSALLLIDIPWFLTEGKLAAIFIKTFSWGFPTGRSFNFIHHRLGPIKFSGAVAGEEVKDLCKGSFSHTHALLCFKFCFTLFLLASFYIKNPKKLESLVVVISLLLVYYVVP